jgi:hypothetical protein
MTRDCPHKNLAAVEQTMNFNKEYFRLMSELNEAELQVEELKPGQGSQLTNFITNYSAADTGHKMIKDK